MPRTTPAPQFLGTCGVCIKKAIIKDVLKFSWCEDHQYRAVVSAYGVATKFRAIMCGLYAIGEGEDLWKTAIAAGTERFMRAVYESIRSIEQQADSQKGA